MLSGAIALPAIKALLLPEAARVLLGPGTESAAGSRSGRADLAQSMKIMEISSPPAENRAFSDHVATGVSAPWGAGCFLCRRLYTEGRKKADCTHSSLCHPRLAPVTNPLPSASS